METVKKIPDTASLKADNFKGRRNKSYLGICDSKGPVSFTTSRNSVSETEYSSDEDPSSKMTDIRTYEATDAPTCLESDRSAAEISIVDN